MVGGEDRLKAREIAQACPKVWRIGHEVPKRVGREAPPRSVFQAEVAIAGDAGGHREGVGEFLKRDPGEFINEVRGKSCLLENRPMLDTIVPQHLAQTRKTKCPDAVLPNVLDLGPVEIRPYAFVHFLPVCTAQNCTATVSPLRGEVKSSMISVNPIGHFFMARWI